MRTSRAQRQKLERWASQELAAVVQRAIIETDTGSYAAFGRYHLIPTATDCTVDVDNGGSYTFSSKRIAMSWCIADNYHQYNLARDILTLDQKNQLLAADIKCRSGLANAGQHQDFYEIVNTKIQPKVEQQRAISSELEKCINLTKYIQIRGFNNETARTSNA